MSDVAKVLEFMPIVTRLCSVRRDILLTNGSPETDSAHIIKLAYLTQLVAPFLKRAADAHHLLELALVHDLVEAECGDVPLCAQSSSLNLKELKRRQEKEAIERYRNMLPPESGAHIYDLFWEYENKSTYEAKVVFVLDKLEANFQACRFQGGNVRYWAEIPHGEWYYHNALWGESAERGCLDELSDPLLEELEQYALYKCRSAIVKSKIPVASNYQLPEFAPGPLCRSIVAFMDNVEKLAFTSRDNLMPDGCRENDADHLLKMCLLLLLLHPYLAHKTDYRRMLPMALFHDLVEADCGDVSLAAQAGSEEVRLLKKQREHEAILNLIRIMPEPVKTNIYELFMEYEERRSPEALTVWAFDKIEACFTGNLYKDGDISYWAEYENGGWYYQNALTPRPLIAKLNDPAVSELERMIIQLTAANMAKYGIQAG